MFITFEGGEGSGKSTQSMLLYEALLRNGYNAILTREPGGTEESLKIRDLVLKGSIDKWSPVTESLLYLADRAEHWNRIIKTELALGKIVICDRFQDSTIVYQGYCKGVSIEFLQYIYSYITGGIFPDITYLLTIDPETGLNRSLNRSGNNETRFESMDIKFHKEVNENFLNLSKEHNKRFVVFEGNGDKQIIHNMIYEHFSSFLLDIN
ncbi:MAG: dTMP kinase [Holosporales bacterium]|jgi:dTMP kinase|nr:dTMP kinase [Holosporales bacterium]